MSAGRKLYTENKSWCTPTKYVNVVKEFFGGTISLDPCSNNYSIVNAEKELMLPFNDGLLEIWNYPTIYVNPPYGLDRERGTSIKQWIEKCVDAYTNYNSEVLALIPVATNTNHWKKYIFGKATAICFLSDTRLKFIIEGNENNKGAPMACAMIYWGNNYDNFYKLFFNYGAVVNICK